jgi:hypothetical protein
MTADDVDTALLVTRGLIALMALWIVGGGLILWRVW